MAPKICYDHIIFYNLQASYNFFNCVCLIYSILGMKAFYIVHQETLILQFLYMDADEVFVLKTP